MKRLSLPLICLVVFASICSASLTGCPSVTNGVVACATIEGKRIAEAAGGELAALWDKDRAAWATRVAELAKRHGRSFLYCIADALDSGKGLVSHGEHTAALRRLARESQS